MAGSSSSSGPPPVVAQSRPSASKARLKIGYGSVAQGRAGRRRRRGRSGRAGCAPAPPLTRMLAVGRLGEGHRADAGVARVDAAWRTPAAWNGCRTGSNSDGRVGRRRVGDRPARPAVNSGLVEGCVVGAGAMPKFGGVVSGDARRRAEVDAAPSSSAVHAGGGPSRGCRPCRSPAPGTRRCGPPGPDRPACPRRRSTGAARS